MLHNFACHFPYTHFPVAHLSLPRSLHSIPSCTAISATFPTLKFRLYSYLCQVSYTQFPVAQLSLPLPYTKFPVAHLSLLCYLHSITSCTAISARLSTLYYQLNIYHCHVSYTQYPVAKLSVPSSLHSIPSCAPIPTTFPVLNSH